MYRTNSDSLRTSFSIRELQDQMARSAEIREKAPPMEAQDLIEQIRGERSPIGWIESRSEKTEQIQAGVDDYQQKRRDDDFNTIVEMFDDPVPFLRLAKRNDEEIAAFKQMDEEAATEYLLKAFKADVAPQLPDRSENANALWFGGKLYARKEQLGKGSYGQVHRYSTGKGDSIAVKSIASGDQIWDFQQTMRELRGHFIAQGRTLAPETRGIAKLMGALWAHDGLVIVLEAMPGGDYVALQRKIDQAIGKRLLDPGSKLLAAIHATIIRDGTKALVEANNHGVVHYDFRVGNLLFDKEGKAKLGDFGRSTTDLESIGGDTGLLQGMAEEKLAGLGHYSNNQLEVLLPDDDDETTRTPNDILKDPAARDVFKRDGVGGPLVRAVIAALTELDLADERSTGRLTAACQAYLSAA